MKPKGTTHGFPELPTKAYSVLGPVEVREAPLENLHGRVDYVPRIITIHQGQHPATAWSTYWHEVVHLALFDAGVDLPEKQAEAVCDALGTYFAAAVREGFIEVKA